MADPTRPPGALDSAYGAVDAGPVLQSVLIGPGRAEAIISGRTVRLGEQFGDARVIKITDAEVVLRNGSEVQTLKLFPSIEKLPASSRVSNKPALRGQEK
ncbi:MSHA biogenesis protein MshK [Noviherbaspirillum cavernae]|uniref:MSHA biogenesis protein MshK n=2 Tax=Noviherbaspirillum cavernae TaxID=2320862 RepID=A0A418X668_9BURK|nr:MSHA biogenesis protein MshK [Noviherbaspirillum cavernae]